MNLILLGTNENGEKNSRAYLYTLYIAIGIGIKRKIVQ